MVRNHHTLTNQLGQSARREMAADGGTITRMDVYTARERMLAGLPATRQALDIAGTSTSVWELGDGPPMILLHGGIECGGAMWAPVVRGLAERHRVVVPDVPGLGESDPVDRLTVEAFARWFVGVLDRTQLHRPVLVAHSLVGSLAARFAAHHSDAVSQLVLYAAPAIGPYRPPMRLRYVAIRFAIRPTAGNAERFDRFALYDLDATRRRDPAWFNAFDVYTRAQAVVPHVKKTMNRLFTSQTKPIPDADLDAIAVPTALLWGRHDRMVPLSVAHHAAERHGWPLHVIEDAAHAPHIEQPQAFIDELERIVGVRH